MRNKIAKIHTNNISKKVKYYISLDKKGNREEDS